MTATDEQITAITRAFNHAAERLPTLFALEDTALQLLAILEDGNLDFLQESEVQTELALVDQLLMQKTESYVAVIRSLETMAEARKAEADRMKARSAMAQRHADWLRERLLTHMKATGRDRIETTRFTLATRLNNPSVVVTDAARVPSSFNRTKVITEVDKGAVLTWTKQTGEVVPGTEVVRTTRLEIR